MTQELDPRAVKRIVGALCLSVFTEWLGATAVLPLLPVYLRHHGSSNELVGLTMAAFYAAALVVQYPVGRLSDRIGRRKIQVSGLIVYSLATVLFIVTANPIFALVFRAIQGAGAGVVDVANAATIGEIVPETHRGRAYGSFWGFRTVAMAIGPFFGGVAGVAGMRWIFLGAAVAALGAVVPIVALVPARRSSAHIAAERAAPRSQLWRNRSFLGVVVAFVAVGVVIGIYETTWSLLLVAKHAQSWEIGLSWALFALPFAVMSFPAGWLVDKMDKRYLVAFALLGSAAFAMTYPFLASVPIIIGLGSAEAILTAIGTPAESAQLSLSVPAAEIGRAQGAASSAQTATVAIAAALSGSLFGVRPWLPFVGGSTLIIISVGVLGLFWRGVSGGPRAVVTMADGSPSRQAALVEADESQALGGVPVSAPAGLARQAPAETTARQQGSQGELARPDPVASL
jgi:DHA1 family multidrug resistance protein-like MFS transporter